ncbi:MAG: hypothetical protein HOQ05_14140 [Corynebacteriales bacterium]|nr:hypothetical protein [Mycobacteriales bacterium]
MAGFVRSLDEFQRVRRQLLHASSTKPPFVDIAVLSDLLAQARAGQLPQIAPPIGGFGGTEANPVPGPHIPVIDTSRGYMRELVRAGVRDPAHIPATLVELRADWINRSSHSLLRHSLSHTTEEAQRARCVQKIDPITGTNTCWVSGEPHRAPSLVTAFKDDATVVLAEGHLWNTAGERRANAHKKKQLYFENWMTARDIFGSKSDSVISAWEAPEEASRPEHAQEVKLGETAEVTAFYKRASLVHQWRVTNIFAAPTSVRKERERAFGRKESLLTKSQGGRRRLVIRSKHHRLGVSSVSFDLCVSQK